MRIAFFEIEPRERERFERSLKGHDCRFFEEPLDAESAALADGCEAVSVFVYSVVDAEVVGKLPGLRFVTTRSMGYDHIDLKACAERGIAVSRVPMYGDHTVAEHAFGLILGLSRNIYKAYERTERHEFDYHGLQGTDLHGKTIGVVGCGKIGVNVVRIARGFGMEVIVADPNVDAALAEREGFSYVPLDELLARADVITLHAPLLPATKHMIDAAAIERMKPGVLLVNTARGGLVDTGALLYGLQKGVIAGAGLDVLEEEGTLREECEVMTDGFARKCDLGALVRNHLLIKRDDVIITPHIGFNSREATDRIIDATVGNLEAFSGGEPLNIVTAKGAV